MSAHTCRHAACTCLVGLRGGCGCEPTGKMLGAGQVSGRGGEGGLVCKLERRGDRDSSLSILYSTLPSGLSRSSCVSGDRAVMGSHLSLPGLCFLVSTTKEWGRSRESSHFSCVAVGLFSFAILKYKIFIQKKFQNEKQHDQPPRRLP